MPKVHFSEESTQLLNEDRRKKFISAQSAQWKREQSNKQLGDSLVSYGDDESIVSFPGGDKAPQGISFDSERSLQHQDRNIPNLDRLVPVSEEAQSNESKTNFASIVQLRLTVARFGSLFKKKLTGEDHGSFHEKRKLRVSRFVRISVIDGNVDDEEEEDNDVLEKIKNYPPFLQNLIRELNLMTAESAALFLWRDPENRIQDPNTYLQASGEVIAMTLVICWILSYIFNPDVFEHNPLKERLGYNDLCVGWDTMPANIVGVAGTTIGCYLSLRFVSLNHTRTELLQDSISDRTKRYVQFTSKIFGFSAAMMPIIFVIKPTDSVYGHSLPFMLFIASSAAVLLGRFLVFQHELSQVKAVYITLYCIVSFLFPIILIAEYIYFSVNGMKSPWPGTITMIVDYSWFLLMTVMPFMLPKDIVLIRKHELGYRPKEI
ncbi:hypothetical protein CTEN210_15278 [Chaetoceros tenuissimus]|uniref:Uncharacterized protein n=1 Tax=Chaetoceros tenuissimus TaxID=426638 RepID=A0AAD3HCI5_9STRA|nr:hypothetical protein CTEN210_15278 [Chaetoceros tenuissimus]